MDESLIRSKAEEHATATVAGDLKTAGASLDKSAYAAAADVMKKLPEAMSGSEITSFRDEGEQAAVTIRYTGASGSADVESTWADREGEPKIVGLKVL